VNLLAAFVLVAIGDSITAGYGLPHPSSQAYPFLVGAALHASRVVDLAVPGTDSAYAAAREVRAIPTDASIVIVNEGTNEMWPVIDHARFDDGPADVASHELAFRRLLAAIVVRAPQARIVVVNTRNYGYDGQRFFAGVSKPAQARFVHNWDRFLDGFAAGRDVVLVDLRCEPFMYDGALFTDGIHPTARGHASIAARVVAALRDPQPPADACPPYDPVKG
jgi:lysophospholipase L1-like esterase